MTAFLVLCVFVIQSCKKDDQTIGLNLHPEGDALNLSRDTIIPTASLFKTDSIRTDELAESYIGNYTDDQFGQCNTEFYCQLELPGSNFNLGDPDYLVLDSVVLSLKTTGNILGSLEGMDISVFALDELLYNDSLYYSNRSTTYHSTDLVKAGENFLEVTNASVINRGDSVFDELRIPLDDKLGKMFLSLDESVAETDETFQEFFNGLAIVSTTPSGAIVGIDPNSGFSALNLYYKDLSGDEIDTLEVAFQLDNNSAYYNKFTRDYTTSVFGDFETSMDVADKVYVQGVDGIMAKLDLSTFPVEKIGDENLGVGTAKLILPVTKFVNNTSELPFILFLSSGTRPDSLKILSDEISSFFIDGYYDSEEEAYIFDCPWHIQNIITGNVDLEPLWISANPPERLREYYSANISSYTRSLVNFKGVVLNGPEFNSQDPSENMRLVITYSE